MCLSVELSSHDKSIRDKKIVNNFVNHGTKNIYIFFLIIHITAMGLSYIYHYQTKHQTLFTFIICEKNVS